MERVAGVGGAGMLRANIVASDDLQTRGREHRQQLGPRAQAQVLGDIRQDQPALPIGGQVVGEPGEKTSQHAALGIIDRALDRRAGTRRDPRWITYHQRSSTRGKQVGREDLHLRGEPEAGDVLTRTGQGAGVLVGRHHPLHAAASEQGGEDPSPGADIKGQRNRGHGHCGQ
nr:hypothetical protein [Nannocystis sp.]